MQLQKSFWFLRLLPLLLLSGIVFTGATQPPAFRRYTDTSALLVSKIIATKNGDLITIFRKADATGPTPSCASIVQRTTGNLTVRWSQRFVNLSIAEVLEAANGDLLFSGTEWSGNGAGGRATPFLMRTESDGSFLWRQNAAASFSATATVSTPEQRLAETPGGKIYFQFLDDPQSPQAFIAYCYTPAGAPVWSRRLTYPAGFVFTDLASTFEGNLLISATVPAGGSRGSVLVVIDSAARPLYFKTMLTATNPVFIYRILKDPLRQQYFFCGDYQDNATLQCFVGKTDADLQALTDLPGTVALPDLFKCVTGQKIFGLDASAAVYALQAGPVPSVTHRRLTDGSTSYLQIPAWKFNSGGQVVWRKRYILPVTVAEPTTLQAAPQLAFVGNRLLSALQTTTPATAAVWLMATDTAGTPDACVVTPEPFTQRRVTVAVGGTRANLITPGVLMNSGSNPVSRAQTLAWADTCLAPRLPKSKFISRSAGGAICTGASISFFDSSFGEPQTWQWLFPPAADLSRADQSCYPNVLNVTFIQPGTYPVSLVVENALGRDTLTRFITVQPTPVPPQLGRDAVLCPADSVVLYYQSVAGANHLFYQVGGPFSSTADSVIIKTPGTYVCRVQSACGSFADTIVVQMAAQPTAGFTAAVFCGSLTVSFTDTSLLNGNSSLNYQWEFLTNGGGLLGSSSLQSPVFTYPAFDSVKVRLIISTALTCLSPDTVEQLLVLKDRPTVSFTYADTCGRLNASFSSTPATGLTAYAWSFGDGATASIANPQHTYTAAGTYTAQLVVTGVNGCTSSVMSNQVAIRAVPSAAFRYGDNACEGQPFLLTDSSAVAGSTISGFYWQNMRSGQVFNTDSIRPVVPAGPVTFRYAVTSAQGCTSDTASKTFLVESIPVAAFQRVNGCPGDTLSFQSDAAIATGAIASYQWQTSAGLTSALPAPSFAFSVAGNYTISHQVVSRNGCQSNVATNTVTVYPAPQPSFRLTPACVNRTTVFTSTTPDSVGATWQWQINGAALSAGANALYHFTAAGNYAVSLRATSVNGCTAEVAKTITAEDFQLQLRATQNPVVEGVPVTISSFANTPYTITGWWPSAAFNRQQLKAQRFDADTSGLITVAAVSGQGCTDTAALFLEVITIDDVYVPSGFTPNGDGLNDVLKVVGSNIADLRFSVYNRWGQMVFYTTGNTSGWDGRVQGQLQATGSYVYVLRVKKTSGRVIEKKGTTTLIR